MNSKILEERLISFSVSIIALSRKIKSSYTGQYLKQQIIRSAISPSLNYGEAQGAESIKDFIHKLKITVKELRETHVCLRIIKQSNIVQENYNIDEEIDECNQLISILVASVKSCQKRLK